MGDLGERGSFTNQLYFKKGDLGVLVLETRVNEVRLENSGKLMGD